MTKYDLRIKASAEKEFAAVPPRDRSRLLIKVSQLVHQPRPHGIEKLAGCPAYRIRQGDYRLIYEIDDENSVVTVIKVGHRREVYR